MKLSAMLFVALVATGAFASEARAHIKLLSPTSALIEDDSGGPDQKTAPCGTGKASNIVTPLQAGQTLTIKWQETVVHPGHFRVALALTDRSQLTDPVATIKNNNCESA